MGTKPPMSPGSAAAAHRNRPARRGIPSPPLLLELGPAGRSKRQIRPPDIAALQVALRQAVPYKMNDIRLHAFNLFSLTFVRFFIAAVAPPNF